MAFRSSHRETRTDRPPISGVSGKATQAKARTWAARCPRIAGEQGRQQQGQGDWGTAKASAGKKKVSASDTIVDLFGEGRLPEDMKYEENCLSVSEEQALLEDIANLPFREFEFHGFTGKRKTVSFGWRYD